ncbi:MAG TPA: hypothetical protein VF406_20155 [Thermodesulfobacteriota bacterium]
MLMRLLFSILALVAIAWATPATAAPTALADSDLDSIVAGHDWKDRHVDRKKDFDRKDFDKKDRGKHLGQKKDRKHKHFADKKKDRAHKRFAHQDRKHHLVKKILVIKHVRLLNLH